MRSCYKPAGDILKGHRRGKAVIRIVIESRDLAGLDRIQKNIDKSLVTIVFSCLVYKRQVHLFMNIYLLPYALAIYGIIFPDMFISEGSTIFYQITLDYSIVTQTFPRRIQ